MDVRHLPAKDVYAYALALLDVMFTKAELARSLIYSSPKSSKPGLPGDRVRRFFRELHQLCLELVGIYMYCSRRGKTTVYVPRLLGSTLNGCGCTTD